MSYARSKFNAGVGSNILAHQDQPTDMGNKLRETGTFKSNITFNAFEAPQKAAHQNNKARDRQFAGNAVQPPATRQSYQDSNIFGNKTNAATVQPAAFSPQKEVKQRMNNTYKSNVMGAPDEAESTKNPPRSAIHRKNAKWESTVFAGPTESIPGRRCLAKEGAGKEGLWGNQQTEWQKKESFAAMMSKKEQTRPPTFDETAAEQRKARELYGEGYRPSKSPLVPKEKVNPGVTNMLDDKPKDSRYERKGNNLQSSILTHEDENVKGSRKGNYSQGGSRLASASNAGWNASTSYSKPVNAGKIDPYKMKQNQLASNAFEQTDYSQFAPINKKKIDMDNIDAIAPVAASEKPKSTAKSEQKPVYSQKSQKQGQLRSSLDDHGYTPASEKKWTPPDEYTQKRTVAIPAKNPNAQRKQTDLASNFLGHDATRYYNKPADVAQVIDIDLSGLPKECDDTTIKQVANVRHVISTDIKYDNFLGHCKGDGRVKIRLNEGETLEMVRANFIRAGYQVKTHVEDPRKKPIVTGAGKDDGSYKTMSAKERRDYALQTKAPVVF